MIEIDGSEGEGGGQILRTSLSLSLVTGSPFRIEKIRAGRTKPGLLRQHLTAVKAAAQIGRAEVDGDALGSLQVVFRPATIRPGSYTFAVGTAGSAGLVLQTVLPPLLLASGPSELTLEGGTHNPWAPPFDFLARAFLPLLRRMGAEVRAALERPGFYPAGGGRFRVSIRPTTGLTPLDLRQRGDVRRTSARALVAHLPIHIAERELKVVRTRLGWKDEDLSVESVENAAGPGNVLIAEIESDRVTEVFTGFGQRNVRAETVAEQVVAGVRRYLSAGVPVGKHLADQLLIPLALARGGSFRTIALTRHSTTNIDILHRFLDVRIRQERFARDDVLVQVGEST
jgi:RNA 3'-terminal phosphate cyclase (ATP)